MKKEIKKIVKEEMSGVKKGVLVGAGLTALVATVAGTYFLYGFKDAKKNRRQVKSWVLKAKGDVLERLEELQDVNEEIYHRVVDEVAEKYKSLKNLDISDVKDFANELKTHWVKIEKDIKKKISGKK